MGLPVAIRVNCTEVQKRFPSMPWSGVSPLQGSEILVAVEIQHDGIVFGVDRIGQPIGEPLQFNRFYAVFFRIEHRPSDDWRAFSISVLDLFFCRSTK